MSFGKVEVECSANYRYFVNDLGFQWSNLYDLKLEFYTGREVNNIIGKQKFYSKAIVA